MSDVRVIPEHLVSYVPKNHRLFYSSKQGALRMDWVMCVCGLGVKLDASEHATDEHWFRAVNQCRLAERMTLLTEDGQEVPPPSLTPPKDATKAEPIKVRKKPGPKPKVRELEAVHA